MAAFKAGEIDFLASFSPEHVDTLKAQVPNAQFMTGKEPTPMLAAMKVAVPKDGKPGSNERMPHPIFGDDQAKAKAFLAEAGYGPAKPLTFELMTNTEKSVFCFACR